jgi:hypothetical protein
MTTHRGTETPRSISTWLGASLPRCVAILLVVLLVPLLVGAQGRRAFRGVKQVAAYTGNLTFTRLYYGGGGLGGFGGFGGDAWSHDYPAADRNIGAIIDYISHVRVNLNETNILSLEDPELFENPILYVWEPGYWTIRPSEAENLRNYLLKGGFVIFDDFEEDHLENLKDQMRVALPDLEFMPIDETHPIFHSFYNITKIDVPHPSVNVIPAYYAMYENNDPTRRMIALANHNSDIAEYWEWSAEGLYNPDPTSNAYRLGVNYFVYAMTH